MSASQRRKGHDYERHIAARYREHGFDAKRGQQSREGDDAPDVDGTPWWIEAKRRKQGCWVVDAYNQAAFASDGREPIVHHKSDRGIELVTIAADYWFWIREVIGDETQRHRPDPEVTED